MAFWIFMLVMDLVLPVSMIGFGKYFMKSPPKEINSAFGYRTSMSMKNRETWEFAHKYFGRIWYICGWIVLPFSIISMLPVMGKGPDCVGTVGGIVCGIQLILFVGGIFPTEMALRKRFHKNGERRQKF